MKTTRPPSSALTTGTDELRMTALGIGHGDAILLQWRDQNKPWTCLVDGGSSPQRLNERLDAAKVGKIDLLVLTHLDTDHVGGLQGITKHREVETFWGPALAAFERHLWLFGDRGVAAIKRGRELEESLRRASVDICYPLEGYESTPHIGAGKVSVLSPPARLIRQLLVEGNVINLFTQQPMPLGWLVGPPPQPPQEEADFLLDLDAALSRGFVEPDDLAGLPLTPSSLSIEKDKFAREWSANTGLDPEFFGDSVLNNTSLVLYIEALTGSRSHRVLLPGDQENWTYLLAKNPRGLQADVFKASHHGGRVYLESDPVHDELFNAVQPRVVLISANGQHKLPRATLREAAIRWGASVACTCSRRVEFFTGASLNDDSCHSLHSCGDAHDVELILDRTGIRSPLPACHSGYGRQLGPVIQVHQHVVDPSPVISHLAEHELRRHIQWLRKKLKEVHEERSRLSPDLVEGSQTISEADLATLAREAGRSLLVAHMDEVLMQGKKRGSIWASQKNRYSRGSIEAYTLPEKEDLDEFLRRISEKVMILFPKPIGEIGRDRISLVSGLELEGLAAYADATIHFPNVMFRDAVWPSVSKAFKSDKWHCFLHRSGAIAFSQHEDAQSLLYAIINAFLGKDRWDEWSVLIDKEEFPFKCQVLVSGSEKHGSALQQYSQSANVTHWFELKQGEVPNSHWRDLMGEGFNATRPSYSSSSEGYGISADTLVKHVKGNVDKIIQCLVPMVEQLW